jgi:hypothetical protein
MTTQTTVDEEPTMPGMPDQLRDQALDLIRDLAAVAGDVDATWRRLRDYCMANPKKDDAFAGVAAALLLTFTECITTPTGPGEFAETSLPTD